MIMFICSYILLFMFSGSQVICLLLNYFFNWGICGFRGPNWSKIT